MTGATHSIAQTFDQYFQIKIATDSELVRQAMRIRYQVYCSELGWEPLNPDEIETDEYDDHATHCLLQHRRTGAYAGCVRLIHTSNVDKVPFEEHCQAAIDPQIIDPKILKRGSFGEISRLAVPEQFRRRKNEKQVPFVLGAPAGTYTDDERRSFPNIALGLYLASIACVDLGGFEHLFVMMEPRLRRHLVRFGLPFHQGGKAIDYHGTRALFFLPRDEFHSHFKEAVHELYELIKDHVALELPKAVSG